MMRNQQTRRGSALLAVITLGAIFAGCASDAASGFAGSCDFPSWGYTRPAVCVEYEGITPAAASRCGDSYPAGNPSPSHCTPSTIGRCQVITDDGAGIVTTTIHYSSAWSASEAQMDCTDHGTTYQYRSQTSRWFAR